jgi:RND superfamily putative drug exporter
LAAPLYGIGRFCSRHHRIVIAVWIVAAVAIALAAKGAGAKTSDNLTLPGTGSTQAQSLLQDRLPDQAYGSNPVVISTAKGKLSDSAAKKAVDDTVTALKNTPHVIRATSPLSSEGKAALSKDGKIGFISVTLDVGPGDLTKDEAQNVVDAAAPARHAGLKTAVGGYVGQAVSKPATESSEVVGLTAAVIILLFAFGTATAMALPIVTAVLGLVIALSAIGLMGHAIEVPSVGATLATMIGLGVGIDYALFIVTRHKQHLRAGLEMEESIARSTATAGGAVAFAGGTVIIALISLAAAGIPLVSALGYTAAVAVLVAVLAATTLLPALLGGLGSHIDSLRVQLGKTHPDDHQPHGWRRWAGGVARRPGISIVASVVVLALLATPLLKLHLGQNDVGALSTATQSRQAYDLLSKGFGPGQNGPLLVAVKLGSPAKPDQKNLDSIDKQQKQIDQQQQKIEQQAEAQGLPPAQAKQQAQQKTSSQQSQLDSQKKKAENPATDPRLTSLSDDVKKAPGMKSVSPPALDKKGDAAVFTATTTTAPSSRTTESDVRGLRDTTIPAATKGTDESALVGGQTARYIDLADRISSKLPSMIAIVVGLSFIVLLLAFRSVVVPIKAGVANLLSVGAAYGVVTFVFQEGHGAGLLGLGGAVPIASFVPLLMFAILFGLSMDYEVFLLTQIKEHYNESGDARQAVIDGLASTGRVITSAAMIMVCVFSSFLLNGDPVVKQFGVGLAVAIAIDATLVRCLLVPAVMVSLGDSSWWLPRWLARALPKISIEGDEFFAERDRAADPSPA